MTIDEIRKLIKAGNVEEANAAMDKLGEKGTHPYILPRVKRFLRMKGLK